MENSTKNATRIASLLGTWTTQANVKVKVGGLKLEGHFVTHFMCDSQLKQNSCSMHHCSERNNKACMIENEEKKCVKTNETIIDWSDVVAFFYLGGKVDTGFPFFIHEAYDMGAWVGPYNIILARNENLITNTTLDSYTVKYIESPKTAYLKKPPECDAYEPEDFYVSFGVGSVKNTVQFQSSESYSAYDHPFDKYYKTCENGDVKPILPSAQFDFVLDETSGNETIEVNFNYHLFTFPQKNDPILKIFQIMMTTGLPITGPYCYGNDPTRGYAIQFKYDSREKEDQLGIMYHKCVSGLPCLPYGAETCKQKNYTGGDIDDDPVDAATTTIDTTELYLCIGIVFLSFVLIIVTIINFRLMKKLQKCQIPTEIRGYYSSDDDSQLSQPLLASEKDDLDLTQFTSSSDEEEEDVKIVL